MLWSVIRTAGLLVAACCAAVAVVATASAKDCEAWNGRAEIRCLSHVPFEEWEGRMLETNGAHVFDVVTLRNIASGPVDFKYQTWQSICNISGTSGTVGVATLQAGQEMRFDLRGMTITAHAPEADPNAGTAATPLRDGGLGADTVLHTFICTELFFLACKAGGAAADCQDHLTATIETQS
jgi:hypothetical protein